MIVNGYEIKRGADLRGADLHGADMRGADLHGADMRGADLSGAGLRRASLRRADLHGAYLSGADLHGADLRGANLHRAYLHGANLRWANLRNVKMNWQSHTLLAEVLRRSAGENVQRRMLAGLVFISTDWCWKDLLRIRHKERRWALSVLAGYITDNDAHPSVLNKYVECA